MFTRTQQAANKIWDWLNGTGWEPALSVPTRKNSVVDLVIEWERRWIQATRSQRRKLNKHAQDYLTEFIGQRTVRVITRCGYDLCSAEQQLESLTQEATNEIDIIAELSYSAIEIRHIRLNS